MRKASLGLVACAQATQSPTCSLIGMASNLRPDDGSRMNREVHVQFCEGVGLRCPALLTYLKAYENVAEARQGIAAYFEFYNHQRLHQALGLPHPAPGLRRSAATCQFGAGEKRWRVPNTDQHNEMQTWAGFLTLRSADRCLEDRVHLSRLFRDSRSVRSSA